MRMSNVRAMIHLIVNEAISSVPSQSEEIEASSDPMLNLFMALGYSKYQYPYAVWLKSLYQLEGQWQIMTPIFWEASHNDAFLLSAGEMFESLGSALTPYFEVIQKDVESLGGMLIQHNAWTWLLYLPNAPLIEAAYPQSLLNQSLKSHLSALDPQGYWQRYLTEIQMLLEQFSFYQTKPILNGVWIWGQAAPIQTHHTIYLNQANLLPFLSQLGQAQMIDNDQSRFKTPSVIYLDKPQMNITQILSKITLPYRYYGTNMGYLLKKKSIMQWILQKLGRN